MTTLTKNQKCVIADSAPHHAGRTGYFQFFGKGPSEGCAILSADEKGTVLFAVAKEHCLPAK